MGVSTKLWEVKNIFFYQLIEFSLLIGCAKAAKLHCRNISALEFSQTTSHHKKPQQWHEDGQKSVPILALPVALLARRS
jgi:hypothetical protein